jgi:hypothetical protein
MSFGPTAQERQFSGGLTNAGNQATNAILPAALQQSGAAFNSGQNLLNMGQGNTAAGTSFFNTLLNGNRQQATQALQPDIDRIRQAQQGTLQAVSTLMPRGGGRSGTLFQLPFQGNAQIQSLYNGIRPAAANTLTQAGLSQTGQGANLFGIGNQGLGVGNQAIGEGIQANAQGLNWAQQQAQRANQMWAGLGSGLFGLATMPLGGQFGLGNTALGKLGGLFGR